LKNVALIGGLIGLLTAPAWAAEMNKLWGYKNKETFIVSYDRGNIPIESSKTPSSITSGYMRFWKVSDVRNFIRAEKRKQQEKS